MIRDRHQIGFQRLRLRLGRRVAADHAQEVGGVADLLLAAGTFTAALLRPRAEFPAAPRRAAPLQLVRLEVDPVTARVRRVELGSLPPPRRLVTSVVLGHTSPRESKRGRGPGSRRPGALLAQGDPGGGTALGRGRQAEDPPGREIRCREILRAPAQLTASGRRNLEPLRVSRSPESNSWILCEVSR